MRITGMREELEEKYDSFYIEILFDRSGIVLFYHYIVFLETESAELKIYTFMAVGGRCYGNPCYLSGTIGACHPYIRH